MAAMKPLYINKKVLSSIEYKAKQAGQTNQATATGGASAGGAAAAAAAAAGGGAVATGDATGAAGATGHPAWLTPPSVCERVYERVNVGQYCKVL